jgi:hypothetical protein
MSNFADMPLRRGSAHFLTCADSIPGPMKAALAPLLLFYKHFLCCPYKNVVSMLLNIGRECAFVAIHAVCVPVIIRHAGGMLSAADWAAHGLSPLRLLNETTGDLCLGLSCSPCVACAMRTKRGSVKAHVHLAHARVCVPILCGVIEGAPRLRPGVAVARPGLLIHRQAKLFCAYRV